MCSIRGELGGRVDIEQGVLIVHPSGVRLTAQRIRIDRVEGAIVDEPTRRLNGQLVIRHRGWDGRPLLTHPVVFRRGRGTESMMDLAWWLEAVATHNARLQGASVLSHHA